MAERVIIHPGYPKTGSTTLQGTVFPDLCRDNGWVYFGKEYGPDGSSKTRPVVREFLRMFPRRDELYFLRNGEVVRAEFGLDGDGTLFISLEELVLRSFKGDISDGLPLTDDLLSSFRKLKALFSDADRLQVMITLRRQSDFLPSLYAQGYSHYYRHIAETRDLDRFLANLLPDATYPHLLSPLYYDMVAQGLWHVFGRENVAVLPFELLKEEPDSFFRLMATFLDVDYTGTTVTRLNTRRGERGWQSRDYSLLAGIRRARRQRNARIRLPRWLRTGIVRLFGAIPLRKAETITMTERQEKIITETFRESNRRLADLTGIDLSRWEYY